MSVLRFDPFSDPFHQFDRFTNQLLSGTRTPASLPMDVWRAGQEYHVALDLPGVEPDSVELTVERGVVTIRAERQQPFAEDDEVLLAERTQGSFTRQLMLGEGVDQENLRAQYRDGVLHLTIPVAEQARPRRISVGLPGGSELPGGSASSGGGRVLRGETVGGSTSDSRPDEAAGGADVDLTRDQTRVSPG
jgi:HSP20 family protein